MLTLLFAVPNTAYACTCTAFGEPVKLTPGETKAFTVMLRNDDQVNTCFYDVGASSSTLNDVVDDATGLPLNASGNLGPGAQVEFTLRATAPATANANSVSWPTSSGGTEFEYTFFNDGVAACTVTPGACVVPSMETNSLLGWYNIDETGPGTLAAFQVTVGGGSATFYGRPVREIFTANWIDSCYYFGSTTTKSTHPTFCSGSGWSIRQPMCLWILRARVPEAT